MSEPTKTCNLTEYEIKGAIRNHCLAVATTIEVEADFSEGIERINYLNKRLKEFKKSDPYAKGTEVVNEAEATASNDGWSAPNGS
jgi:hypothetical protein